MSYLDFCSEIMDVEELFQKWKKVSFVYLNNILLWRYYVFRVIQVFGVFIW